MTEPKRVCQIIKLKPEHLAEYKRIHNPAPSIVLSNLRKYHIEDYSIHHAPQLDLLVAHFKYTGEDFARDAAAMRADPANREWWSITDELQDTMVEGSKGSTDEKGWWLDLEEVFRFEK